MVELLLKYPTRSRPDLFKSTFGKYVNLLSGGHSYKFVISCDEDDSLMNNKEMIDYILKFPHVELFFNPQPQTKISAINANMENQDFRVLLLVSDDMIPESKGYDHIILENMKHHFGENEFGVLHYNDGRIGNRLNTLSIMNKKMYDYFGYIYHPKYISLWCDNEFHNVSKDRIGCSTYINNVIIRHKWRETNDSLYDRNEGLHSIDANTFHDRKTKKYPRENHFIITRKEASGLPIRKIGIITNNYRPISGEIPSNCILKTLTVSNWETLRDSIISLKSQEVDTFCFIDDYIFKNRLLFHMLELHKYYYGIIVGEENTNHPEYSVFDNFAISDGFDGKNFLFGIDLYDKIVPNMNNKHWNWDVSSKLHKEKIPVIYAI